MTHVLSVTLFLLAACSGGNTDPATAASMAKAIQANPAQAAQVLEAHGLTEAQFEAVLYDIAKDPAASAAYAKALAE